MAGAATGVVTAATGVFVIPAVPYLQALDLGREDLVQALGLSFTVSTLALAADMPKRKYKFIDISREKVDGNPRHSGVSVLRGRISNIQAPSQATGGQSTTPQGQSTTP